MFQPGELPLLRADGVTLQMPHTPGGNLWESRDLRANHTLRYLSPFHALPSGHVIEGSVLVTNYRVLFFTSLGRQSFANLVTLGFPLSHIRAVETPEEKELGASPTLPITLRLFTPQQVVLALPRQQGDQLASYIRCLIVSPTLHPLTPALARGLSLITAGDHNLTGCYDRVHYSPALMGPAHFYQTPDVCASFVYSAPHKRVISGIAGYESLQLPLRQLYSNRGFSLYDPIREFRRQGVVCPLPSKEQLAKMVFGARIHPNLLEYLLTCRPVRSVDYCRDAASLVARLRGAVFSTKFSSLASLRTLYEAIFTSNYYDPFLLFPNADAFYDILAAHPQAKEPAYGKGTWTAGETVIIDDDDNEEDIDDSKTGPTSAISSQVPSQNALQPGSQPGTQLGSQFGPQFASGSSAPSSSVANRFGRKDKKEKDKGPAPSPDTTSPPSQGSGFANDLTLDFSLRDPSTGTPLYAHGPFFEPTFLRVSPHMRHYVASFLFGQLPAFVDTVHSPPMLPPYLSREGWTISWVNGAYDRSPTYPAVLAVPDTVTDDIVTGAMKFRSKGRFCTLSWRSPTTGAALCRCSQPGKGFGLSRSSADEALLKAICNSPPSDISKNLLFVFDARPFLSAFANRFTGKGFESTKAYPFTKTVYLNIQNIHVIRDSFNEMRKVAIKFLATRETPLSGVLQDLAQDAPQGGPGAIALATQDSAAAIAASASHCEVFRSAEASKWYEHLQTIMAGAIMICEAMTKLRCHAMIHCSDGWDRTSQLSSLAMLLLDPYYRTLRGFCILIEKEWCGFGHMFATRCRQPGSTKAKPRKNRGPSATCSCCVPAPQYNQPAVATLLGASRPPQPTPGGATAAEAEIGRFLSAADRNQPLGPLPIPESGLEYSSSQTSPIFFQWLECVFQVMTQRPSEFEFNERALLLIAHHLYSGRNGTFIFDNERDRTHHLVQTLTTSVWDTFLADPSYYLNPGYSPETPLNLSKMALGTGYLKVSCSRRSMTPWASFWSQVSERGGPE